MRLSDAMRPAMDWSEAAMLPARPRTLSGGAALRQLRRVDAAERLPVPDMEKPAPPPDARLQRSRWLRRAAYRQILRGSGGLRRAYRANSWVM